MAFPKRYAEFAARARVPAGMVVGVLFVWLSRPDWGSLALGMPWAAAGMLLRGWAAGHLEKNLRLTTSGPFARVRNPLYLGSLLAGMGFAVAASHGLVLVLTGVFFLFFYLPVVEEEERHLGTLFPEYEEYRGRVPKLMPRLRAAYHGGNGFRRRVYLRNREYEALGAFLLVSAVLAAKAARL